MDNYISISVNWQRTEASILFKQLTEMKQKIYKRLLSTPVLCLLRKSFGKNDTIMLSLKTKIPVNYIYLIYSICVISKIVV